MNRSLFSLDICHVYGLSINTLLEADMVLADASFVTVMLGANRSMSKKKK